MLRRQPGRKRSSAEDRVFRLASWRSRLPELQRDGPVLVRRIGKHVTTWAFALDSGNQRAAIMGLHGTHHFGKPCRQIVKVGIGTSAQASLRHWRHEPGRTGQWILEVRYTKVPGQRNIGTIAGLLSPTQLEPPPIERRQHRQNVNMAGFRIVVTPSLPRHPLTGQPQRGPHHADRPAPSCPGQAAPAGQGQGDGQDFGRPIGCGAQLLEQPECRRLRQQRHRGRNRRH